MYAFSRCFIQKWLIFIIFSNETTYIIINNKWIIVNYC